MIFKNNRNLGDCLCFSTKSNRSRYDRYSIGNKGGSMSWTGAFRWDQSKSWTSKVTQSLKK